MPLKIVRRDLNHYPNIYVCGDIHGMYDRLVALLSKIPYGPDDLFVFLGDYIDRGTASDKVLDRIMQLENETNVVALMGNHEAMALASYNPYANPGDIELWHMNGGKETIEAFKLTEKTEEYMAWIAERPHILSLNNRIFMSHAGIDPHKELAEQTLDDVLWLRTTFFDGYHGDNDWYVGHTPVQYMGEVGYVKPLKLDNKIMMMDTGSYLRYGCISCIELKSGQLYQSY